MVRVVRIVPWLFGLGACAPEPPVAGAGWVADAKSGSGCTDVTSGDRTRSFCTTSSSWSDAQASCAALGAHLADVDDAADDAALFAGAQAVGAGNWWFGANDRAAEGAWVWDGGSDSPYTNWSAGEPNDFGGNEDCTWYTVAGAGAWNDKDCAATAWFICQVGCETHTRYADADGDGYGDAATVDRVCDGALGWVADATDCDDADPALSPETVWYGDGDGDGYAGGSLTVAACEPPAGYGPVVEDCDDADANAFPGASELPADGVDQDCDGADGCTWYADGDGDGWGDDAAPTEDCGGAPAGFVAAGGDCDDTDAASFPGAPDAAYDGVDADCGGGSDDDADGDGVEGNGGPDCDDTDPDVAPGAEEACDGVDDDCDGAVDVGAACPGEVLAYDDHAYFLVSGATTWVSAQATCSAWGYHLVDVRDAAEAAWVWGEAEAASATSSWWHGANDRATEGAFVWDGGSASGYADWRAGEPNDFGGNEDCAAFADDGGGAWNDRDCENAYPFVCEAGCERLEWFADADADGTGDASVPSQACEAPAGFVDNDEDCDDANAAVLPGATERCNGVDDECDALVDDADPDVDPASFATWYADHDGDGHGIPEESLRACSAPEGWAATSTDCDDEDAAVYAGAPDPVDGLDADCGGEDEAWDGDADGVLDTVERRLGLDPGSADSDADGLGDGVELGDPATPWDHDGDGVVDALDPDDDGDTLPTAEEIGGAGALDTDGDGTPDHLDLDSDADGSADAAEAGRDSDHDGVPNAREADDDGDGRNSAAEDAATPDADEDGVPNSLDLDSDGDGCPDADEGDSAWLDAAGACPGDSGGTELSEASPPLAGDDGGCGCGGGAPVRAARVLPVLLVSILRRRAPVRSAGG